MGIGAVYWMMRFGFDDPVLPIAKQVALGLFIIAFPALVRGDIIRKTNTDEGPGVRWWSSYPFLWLIALVLTAELGRFITPLGVDVFPVVALVGLLAYAIVFVRWLPRSSAWRTLSVIVGCGLFSVWASGVVWGRIYKN